MGAKDPGSVSVDPVGFPAADTAHAPGGEALLSDAAAVVQETAVVLDVRLGEVRLSVKQLMALREGSVLELDRDLDEPVDVLLNGKLIARGRLVARDDQFGVEITEIRSAG